MRNIITWLKFKLAGKPYTLAQIKACGRIWKEVERIERKGK